MLGRGARVGIHQDFATINVQTLWEAGYAFSLDIVDRTIHRSSSCRNKAGPEKVQGLSRQSKSTWQLLASRKRIGCTDVITEPLCTTSSNLDEFHHPRALNQGRIARRRQGGRDADSMSTVAAQLGIYVE